MHDLREHAVKKTCEQYTRVLKKMGQEHNPLLNKWLCYYDTMLTRKLMNDIVNMMLKILENFGELDLNF